MAQVRTGMMLRLTWIVIEICYRNYCSGFRVAFVKYSSKCHLYIKAQNISILTEFTEIFLFPLTWAFTKDYRVYLDGIL